MKCSHSYYNAKLSVQSVSIQCVFCVCSAEGGGKDSFLPGSGLRSVLATTPPQPYPEAYHL